MLVDIHNHTKLCNHASGEMDEFVLKAIKNGTKYFGFSDHAPMDFDKKYRMSFDEVPLYESKVLTLKERYSKDLDILLGYEVDYLPGYMDKRVLKAKVDYLIGSVHFLDGWGFDNPEFIKDYKNRDLDLIWSNYFNAIKDMAKSGLFDIVGHIDLMKLFNFLPKKDIRVIAQDAIKAIKDADMVVELNSAGLRKPCKEIYPGEKLMELISEYEIPITFGSDAHKPEDVGAGAKELLQAAERFGYKKCAVFKNRDRELINF